jgi:hypothetical protein
VSSLLLKTLHLATVLIGVEGLVAQSVVVTALHLMRGSFMLVARRVTLTPWRPMARSSCQTVSFMGMTLGHSASPGIPWLRDVAQR